MKTKYRKNTLEYAVAEILASLPGDAFNVIAFEMTHDGEGWSVNTPFRIASGVAKEDIPEIVRGRWELIAANYGRKTVAGLTDISYLETEACLESDCFPIVNILPADA